MSDSLRPHGLPIRLLRPWDFLGKSAGVDCHFLLQGIFPTQESNPGFPHCRQMLYHLSHQGREHPMYSLVPTWLWPESFTVRCLLQMYVTASTPGYSVHPSRASLYAPLCASGVEETREGEDPDHACKGLAVQLGNPRSQQG